MDMDCHRSRTCDWLGRSLAGSNNGGGGYWSVATESGESYLAQLLGKCLRGKSLANWLNNLQCAFLSNPLISVPPMGHIPCGACSLRNCLSSIEFCPMHARSPQHWIRLISSPS